MQKVNIDFSSIRLLGDPGWNCQIFYRFASVSLVFVPLPPTLASLTFLSKKTSLTPPLSETILTWKGVAHTTTYIDKLSKEVVIEGSSLLFPCQSIRAIFHMTRLMMMMTLGNMIHHVMTAKMWPQLTDKNTNIYEFCWKEHLSTTSSCEEQVS